MHNSTQTDIILTLLVFAAIWILISYIIYRTRKNDDTGDISGTLNRDEMRYISKFRQTVRALVVSYMYDDYKLYIRRDVTTNEPRAFLIKGSIVRFVDMRIVRSLVKFNKIRIDDLEADGTTISVLYEPTLLTYLWCAAVLIRYRSIMKTITEFKYI